MLVLSRHSPRYVAIKCLNMTRALEHDVPRPIYHHPSSLHALPYNEWSEMYEHELDDMCRYIMQSLDVEARDQGYILSLNYALLLKEISAYMYKSSSCVSKRWKD